MRVAITGAAGFLGGLLATELLRRNTLRGAPIDEILLVDRVRNDRHDGDGRVTWVEGDLLDTLPRVFSQTVDVLFHLAAAVSGESEQDFDLGMRSNLDGTRQLLEAGRAQSLHGGRPPVIVMASSVAVYGGDPDAPQPDQRREYDAVLPSSSYGTQKAVGELLAADYTRRNFVDCRVVRLMTVAVRPGAANAAASSFVSGIIREPLRGEDAICPVDPSLELAIASPQTTITGLVQIAELQRGQTTDSLRGRLPINIPALTVSVEEMLAALRRLAGDKVADLVRVERDAATEAIVGSWPAAFDNSRALELGILGDESIDQVILQYIEGHASVYAPAVVND